MEDDRMDRLGAGGEEEEEDGEEEEEEEEGKGGNITTELVLYDDDDQEEEEEEAEARAPVRKKRRGNGNVQSLLEAVIARQQRFFSDLLESMERKEQIREQIRQEREDKWRAEERAQLGVFNNALMALTRELVGSDGAGLHGVTGLLLGSSRPPHQQGPGGGPSLEGKSRFKNWKRAEVVQLIKVRGEMDSRFAMTTKRAELWDELCDRLAAQGIRRDGKQCREKWDKLMALYKDVVEGKRDQDETPYFAELRNILRRPGTAA